jgi:hypothetical protein
MIILGEWNTVTYCQMFMEGDRLTDKLAISDEVHFKSYKLCQVAEENSEHFHQ